MYADFPEQWLLIRTRTWFDRFIFRIRKFNDGELPLDRFPTAVWITIRLRGPERSKLLDKAEALENMIETNAEVPGLALLAGCVTRRRTRELLYYINDSNSFRNAVERCVQDGLKMSVMEYPNDRGAAYAGLKEILERAETPRFG